MCGLIGFSGSKNYDQMSINFLMMANITRGAHSTGYFDGKDLIKDTKPVHEFLSENSPKPSKIFVGHTRQASVGAKTVANSHPFRYGNIVGAHNGTLKNYSKFLTEIGWTHNDYDVDSQILIKLIDHNGGKLSFMPELEGAAAIIWHDAGDDTLNFWRNFERPLFYGIKKGVGVYVSSLKESLKAIKIGEDDITEVEEYTHYKLKDGDFISVEKNIRNKVYTYNTLPAGGYHQAEDIIYPQSYAIATRSFNAITKGNRYFIFSVKGDYVSLIDDDNKVRELHKYSFNKTPALFQGSYAKMARNATKVGLKMNDLMYVKAYKWENGIKILECEDVPFKNRIVTLSSRYLIALTKEEIEDSIYPIINNKQTMTKGISKETIYEWTGEDRQISAKETFADLVAIRSMLFMAIEKLEINVGSIAEEEAKNLHLVLADVDDAIISIKEGVTK